MAQMIKNATGVVLAGGLSRRFGSNKALAFLEGKKLVESASSRLGSLFPEILVLSKNPDDFKFLENDRIKVKQDLLDAYSPIVGIYSALECSKTNYSFVCGTDMPFLKEELIRFLWKKTRGFDAAVPVWKGKPQPLAGFYSRDCLTAIQGLIKRKELAVQGLLRSVRTFFLRENFVQRIDPEGISFFDIDTPLDHVRAGKLIHCHAG